MQEQNAICITMKNTRDNKNIHIFAKTLLSMEQFSQSSSMTDAISSKTVYLYITRNGEVCLSSKQAQDLWKYYAGQQSESSYFVKFSNKIIDVKEVPKQNTVIALPLKHLLAFFDQKTETKMFRVKLLFQANRMLADFATEELNGAITFNYHTINPIWPSLNEQALLREGKRLIPVCEIQFETCKKFIEFQKDVHLYFTANGIEFKKLKDNAFGWIHPISVDQLKNYDFQMLKRQLRGRLYVSVNDGSFLKHFKFCGRQKISCHLKLVLPLNTYQEGSIDLVHILLQSQTENKADSIQKIFPAVTRERAQFSHDSARMPVRPVHLNQLNSIKHEYQNPMDYFKRILINQRFDPDVKGVPRGQEQLNKDLMNYGKVTKTESSSRNRGKFQI